VLPEGSEPPHQRCICSAAVSPVKRPRAASLWIDGQPSLGV